MPAGEAVVVIVVESVAGDEVVVVVEEPLPVAGEGLTIVVLFSVAGAGEPAAGVTTVRCSQDERRAALARIHMVFFIIFLGLSRFGDNWESEKPDHLALLTAI